jgi:hypothetical protein
LIPTAVLLVLMAIDKPSHSGIGLAVVLLGLPVYHMVFARRAPRGVLGEISNPGEASSATTGVETT